ncbi:glycosyltransferase [Photobacterium sp. DNB23_23_1]|uniref:Glycosyltransferase n=1 Tax=Photobacterium pectinilyticum TaxID=2906793 RepID=A0ABT1N587_9GAMM|nr:glycosyltransferase [Photobacterium sp. ZSDE20]MCQ1059915.1 glycosyltransferase [Photobacterium sp. ZSDE20]MDD1826508.1 glycosyltransferase [Photobacterium sp. ZSDE20]
MTTTTLQVVQHLSPGGIERLVLNLVRFASPDNQVYVVALEGNKDQAIEQWPELAPLAERLYFLNKPHGRDIKTIFKLRRLIRTLQAKVIHSHHLGPLLYSRAASLGLKGITHIQTEHDSWHLEDPKQRLLTRSLLAGSNIQLVADAPRIADHLESQGISADHVIINGIDTHHYVPGQANQARHHLQVPTDKLIIGCAGRLVREKGIDTLLEALAALPEVYHVVVAGHGPERIQLEHLSQQLGLSERVHWLGRCDNMLNFYHAIDLFCMPSRQEGLPLALLEAQACGKPVIASDVGGIPDLICPHSGHLIPAEHPTVLAKALHDRLRTPIHDCHQTTQYIRRLADVREMTASYESLANR